MESLNQDENSGDSTDSTETRKSRRSNRGQRYKALMQQGVLNPGKSRKNSHRQVGEQLGKHTCHKTRLVLATYVWFSLHQGWVLDTLDWTALQCHPPSNQKPRLCTHGVTLVTLIAAVTRRRILRFPPPNSWRECHPHTVPRLLLYPPWYPSVVRIHCTETHHQCCIPRLRGVFHS